MPWNYASQTVAALHALMPLRTCVYCGTALHAFDRVAHTESWGDSQHWDVQTCMSCGWWKIAEQTHIEEGNLYRAFRSGAVGSLRQLARMESGAAVGEIGSLLVAKQTEESGTSLSTIKTIVADVCRNYSYELAVAAKTADGAIATILSGTKGDYVGLEVRRAHGSITISHIRELLGARVVNDVTEGIFLAITRPPAAIAGKGEAAEELDLAVVLVEGTTFFEALQIEKRNALDDRDVPTLIEKATFTQLADTGTRRTDLYRFWQPYEAQSASDEFPRETERRCEP